MDHKRTISFIDCEFTGLNYTVNEVISASIIRVVQEYQDGNFSFHGVDDLDIKLKIEDKEVVDGYALKMTGYSEEAWADALPQKAGLAILSDRLTELHDEDSDKDPLDTNRVNWSVMAGHNVHNDFCILYNSFHRHGIEHRPNKYMIDTHSMAVPLLFGHDDIKSLGLASLAEHFGVVNTAPHTALGDVRATFEVYKKLLESAGHKVNG